MTPRLRIAVVDDEESVRRALGRLLIAKGLDVELYSDGAALLAGLGSQQFDCIILDLHMPHRSGFELLESLTRAANCPPVVVITGHDLPDSEARALGLGAAAFLRKPVRAQPLLDSIAAAVSERPLSEKRRSS